MGALEVRRFTRAGMLDVARRLGQIKAGQTVEFEDLLSDGPGSEGASPRTEIVSPGLTVEVKALANRMEVGRFFTDLLAPLPRDQVEKDAGLWTWLAWAWMDHLAPVKSGVRDLGASPRWVLAVEEWKRYYRHLFAGPFYIYKAHEDEPHRADAVLCGPITKPGEVVEQVMARVDLVRSPGLMGAVTKLYFDPDKKAIKRGAGGKGAGSARRLGPVLMQLDRTWDIYSLESDDVLRLLPAEFDGFRPATASK